MNIYVGNLPYNISNDELANVFAQYGEVAAARIVMDRDSGRSKGFGFVEMNNNDEANAAIQALNNSEISGRKAVVNEARPREERPRGDFGGGGERRGGGFGGGFGGGERRGGFGGGDRRGGGGYR